MICAVCGHSESDKPRSVRQLRLYFGLLGLIREHTDHPAFQGKDGKHNLHEAIKEDLGYVEPRYGLDGQIKGYKTKSISIGSMDHETFCAFFEKVKDLVFVKILPNVEQESFEKELFNLLGIGFYER